MVHRLVPEFSPANYNGDFVDVLITVILQLVTMLDPY